MHTSCLYFSLTPEGRTAIYRQRMPPFPISLRRRQISNLIRGIDSPLGVSLVSCVFVPPLMRSVTPHKVERPASEEEVRETTQHRHSLRRARCTPCG
jgi:hypothetical protein